MSFVRNRGVSRGTLGGLGVLGDDLWVVEVLRFGYRIPFHVIPFLSQVPIPLPSYSPSSIRGMALSAAVVDLQKGAVEPAPSSPGYYSRLFVTPQGHRGLATCDRPVTPQLICASPPFSHGYGSVGSPVSSSGRLDGVPGSPGRLPSGSSAPVISALPEVLHGDSVLQFRALCFGLSTAPQVFMQVMAPISSIMHHYRLRILRYLDDWLILGSSFRERAGEGLSSLTLSGAGCPSQPR